MEDRQFFFQNHSYLCEVGKRQGWQEVQKDVIVVRPFRLEQNNQIFLF